MSDLSDNLSPRGYSKISLLDSFLIHFSFPFLCNNFTSSWDLLCTLPLLLFLLNILVGLCQNPQAGTFFGTQMKRGAARRQLRGLRLPSCTFIVLFSLFLVTGENSLKSHFEKSQCQRLSGQRLFQRVSKRGLVSIFSSLNYTWKVLI